MKIRVLPRYISCFVLLNFLEYRSFCICLSENWEISSWRYCKRLSCWTYPFPRSNILDSYLLRKHMSPTNVIKVRIGAVPLWREILLSSYLCWAISNNPTSCRGYRMLRSHRRENWYIPATVYNTWTRTEENSAPSTCHREPVCEGGVSKVWCGGCSHPGLWKCCTTTRAKRVWWSIHTGWQQ